MPKVFENESLVVYDKPVGMPVHPSVKHQGDTLGNCFSADYPGVRFRPVNRLDRDTSGLCAAAKNPFAAAALQRGIEKIYYAVIQGSLKDSGTIDLPIARERDSIIRRVVRQDGQRAVTHYKAIAGNSRFTLLEIKLETGRTHQIRVHMASIGHPILGDDVYCHARSGYKLQGQTLHAGVLGFIHPSTGEYMEFKAPLPGYFEKLLNDLRNGGSN